MEKVWGNPEFKFPGGESNNMAQARGLRAVLKVIEMYNGKNIVVGTHGNLMVLIMNYFDNTYGYVFWKSLQMPAIYRLRFEDNRFIDCKKILD